MRRPWRQHHIQSGITHKRHLHADSAVAEIRVFESFLTGFECQSIESEFVGNSPKSGPVCKDGRPDQGLAGDGISDIAADCRLLSPHAHT